MPSNIQFTSIRKFVTTATTAVALSTTLLVRYLRIKAEATNTGIIYVGGSDVALANGYELAAGEEMVWEDLSGKDNVEEIDLAEVFIDTTVNTDGVSVLYAK